MRDLLIPADSGVRPVPIDAVTTERLPRTLNALLPQASAWLGSTGYSAKVGEIGLVPDPDGGIARVLLGLGSGTDVPPLLAGKLPAVLPPGAYHLREGFADLSLATIAWALGGYSFDSYRRRPERARLVLSPVVDGAEIAAIVDSVYLARDLVNTPANALGPAELAAAAADLANRHSASFSEITGDGLAAGGFDLIAAVGAAASPDRAPRLIDLTWGDASAPRVTIVGKGVCFDTGGVDIKTAAGMLLMKKDMGGAANALGLAQMIMRAGLNVRLRVLIPAVENAIASAAFRPGDVFKARNGVTVEVGNTDAEGRLILADALSLAAEETPALLVDLATLTGAARVALGPEVVPVFTPDDRLAADLERHGNAVADPVWRMPLWQPYTSYLDSPIADINNVGQSAFAGTILAALFLTRFVPKDVAWLHADIYAWNPKTLPGRPEGGEAQVIRALFGLLKERYGP